jgi:hypothetical protein
MEIRKDLSMYSGFENLLVWQKAFELADAIIPFIQDHFPTYSKLGDQLLASAVSVPSNIDEGNWTLAAS